jgi:lysophospholipase L1-like esterase
MTSQSPSAPAIVVIGASYAGAWPFKTVGGHTVVNKGVPGQQSFELAERFDRDVIALRPRAVIIWGFINDVFRSDRSAIPATLTRTRESFDKMIAAARSAGIEPVLATEVTIGPKQTWRDTIMGYVGWMLGKESYQQYINSHVAATNAWVRERASRDGLLLLDLEKVLAGPDGMRRPEFSQEDGSHISEAGYSALTAYAGPALERRLSR